MKLPNGFGSVYKLSGNRRNPYVAKKTKGWEIDPITGKSKQLYITVGYYPTRKEALTALAEYNKDPFDLHHATITFEEVYENWSEIHFEKIKDTNGYRAAFNTSKPLWKMRFVDIKLDHLQSVVDSSGKNTPTLKTLKILWGLMYDYAVIHEIVSQDKQGGKSERIQPETFFKERDFYSVEMQGFKHICDRHPYYDLFRCPYRGTPRP